MPLRIPSVSVCGFAQPQGTCWPDRPWIMDATAGVSLRRASTPVITPHIFVFCRCLAVLPSCLSFSFSQPLQACSTVCVSCAHLSASMRLNVYILAILWQTVLPVSRVVVDADTCDLVDVTAPVSLRDSTGWDRDPAGAGERRQGHISAEIQAWGQDHIVVYGGTSVRTDGVNDVTGGGSRVSILDISSQQNWTELEMVGESRGPLYTWYESTNNMVPLLLCPWSTTFYTQLRQGRSAEDFKHDQYTRTKLVCEM